MMERGDCSGDGRANCFRKNVKVQGRFGQGMPTVLTKLSGERMLVGSCATSTLVGLG
eukprot:COSAG02_NODE_438_length_22319_cov_17.198425_11_plen_57_part_00